MKNLIALMGLAAMTVTATGCTVQGTGAAPTSQEVQAQHGRLQALSKSKVVSIVDKPYLGASRISQPLAENSPLLDQNVTLRQHGSLRSIAAAIGSIVSVRVSVEDSGIETKSNPRPKPRDDDDEDFPELYRDEEYGPGFVEVDYRGPLRGLLDLVSSQSGYGWDYEKKSNRITFNAMQTKTFTIAAAPGKVTFSSQVSNKAKGQSSGGTLGSGVNSTVSTGDSTAQTSQVSTTKLELDTWREVREGVEKLISKDGSCTINESAGTITVRERWARMREISKFLDDINARLSRQVAVTIRVWSLDVSDDSTAGLNLQALFENSDVNVVAGSLSALGGAGTAAASVVSGKLKDSSSTIKALKTWGKATQLTSGGGLVTNDQPLPIQAVSRKAYVAGMTLATSEYNQTSEVTPGEVTTGFSMTLVPHILEDRKVLLQYNISLSSLDEMTEIDKNSIYVQLPSVSTKSFSQRSQIKMGETLVLAGFEQTRQSDSKSVGLFSGGRSTDYSRNLIIVTIQLESAENV